MSGSSKYRPLPVAAQALLEQLAASPRLIAHLTLTHDVAPRLEAEIKSRWPDLPLDEDAVLFGTAIHDIGKTVHPEELRQSGNRHEAAGERLLLAAGVSAEWARFCRTHSEWNAEGPLEDLLVAVADKVWKGKRDEPLEQAIVDLISNSAGEPRWKIFVALDDLLTRIAETSDERLSWQRSFPV